MAADQKQFETCSSCQGDGYCSDCLGTLGWIVEECGGCSETGDCPDCDGTGKVSIKHKEEAQTDVGHL